MRVKKEDIESLIVGHILDNEIGPVKRNRDVSEEDYQSFVDLLDSVRDEKEYDWMSDIRLPEFASQMLTQSAIDAEAFKSREYTEVFVDDNSDAAQRGAAAQKELVNRTLNQRHLHHYLKFIRGKLINHLVGHVYGVCCWEKEWEERKVKELSPREEELFRSYGFEVEDTPDEGSDVVRVFTKDQFNYDIIDESDFFESPEYTYSLQEKRWVAYRVKRTLGDMLSKVGSEGYVNLARLKEIRNKESQANDTDDFTEQDPIDRLFYLYTRFGKFWCMVDERDQFGRPTKVRPGLGESGLPMRGAELVETLISFVTLDKEEGDERILVRFGTTPFVDARGRTYRPTLKGLCYVHPTSDLGIGDGKYGRELQTAVDDTFNLGNDRVKVATMPTFIGSRGMMESNDEVYIAPEHIIPADDPKRDLVPLELSDNVVGSMSQLSLLFNKMNQVMSIFPTTMGGLPEFSSTTATAVAGGEQRTNMRGGFKALTFEYTFLTELYWMIGQMTWAFAEDSTAVDLMGDKAFDFDPSREFWYKSVTQAVETDSSRTVKMQNWTQILQMVVGSGHPDATKMFNYIMVKVLELMGDEYENFSDKMFDEGKPLRGERGGDGERGGVPVSNQNGVPMSSMETTMREGTYGRR